MAAFPALKSGRVGMYPLARAVGYSTRVVQFADDSEQRWRGRTRFESFSLEFADVSGYDLGLIRDFWITAKGRMDSTWTITVGGVTYARMEFETDAFTVTETKPERYAVRLLCKQWRG
jgi:hypothetical protein